MRSIYRAATQRGERISSGISSQLYGRRRTTIAGIRLKFRTIRRAVAMRDACMAIRIFHETIVARRPNSIAEKLVMYQTLFFLNPPICDGMDAAAFHCTYRRTRYFCETALRYCARMHVSTMYPSSTFRNIVRYRRVFHVSNVSIYV